HGRQREERHRVERRADVTKAHGSFHAAEPNRARRASVANPPSSSRFDHAQKKKNQPPRRRGHRGFFGQRSRSMRADGVFDVHLERGAPSRSRRSTRFQRAARSEAQPNISIAAPCRASGASRAAKTIAFATSVAVICGAKPLPVSIWV